MSVLDLAVVADGSGVGRALTESIDLARSAERLGYRRFWVAEHHNMPGIASSAAARADGHIADATTIMRVGLRRVMLPNQAPLVVAEQFGTLEALHPGRIDLGIGRAPGTDQVTALALRRSPDALSADDFPEQLGELLGFFTGRGPGPPVRADHRRARPGDQPAMWLLGSSGYSAQLAGLLGLPVRLRPPLQRRRTRCPRWPCTGRDFRPSEHPEPPVRHGGRRGHLRRHRRAGPWLAGPSRLAFLRLRRAVRAAAHPRGGGRLPVLAEPSARHHRRTGQATQIIGSPQTVRRRTAPAARATRPTS